MIVFLNMSVLVLESEEHKTPHMRIETNDLSIVCTAEYDIPLESKREHE